MKTFLANAFAVVRLATVQEFQLSRSDTNFRLFLLTIISDQKTNKIEPRSYFMHE
uniref:Bm611 n=1 Tax=Brugia malayi TaxID=6279 RepID=A0A1I9G428_BRUMA|nr:Bm611 [Brugia malayi]